MVNAVRNGFFFFVQKEIPGRCECQEISDILDHCLIQGTVVSGQTEDGCIYEILLPGHCVGGKRRTVITGYEEILAFQLFDHRQGKKSCKQKCRTDTSAQSYKGVSADLLNKDDKQYRTENTAKKKGQIMGKRKQTKTCRQQFPGIGILTAEDFIHAGKNDRKKGKGKDLSKGASDKNVRDPVIGKKISRGSHQGNCCLSAYSFRKPAHGIS